MEALAGAAPVVAAGQYGGLRLYVSRLEAVEGRQGLQGILGGSFRPVSQLRMVWPVTPRCSPAACWVNPAWRRAVRSDFPKVVRAACFAADAMSLFVVSMRWRVPVFRQTEQCWYEMDFGVGEGVGDCGKGETGGGSALKRLFRESGGM